MNSNNNNDRDVPPRGPARHRVLLAEDDEASRLLAAHTLEHFDCDVTVVSDGESAYDAMRTGDFDIIFMDFHMPRMNGLQSTQAIRAWEVAENIAPIPIVAVTASAMPSERQQCLHAGMNDVLTKPFNLRELERLLGAWSHPDDKS